MDFIGGPVPPVIGADGIQVYKWSQNRWLHPLVASNGQDSQNRNENGEKEIFHCRYVLVIDYSYQK